MLQWEPTKARPDEVKKLLKKPDLQPREGLKTKNKKVRNLSPPRYLIIRQTSPPRQNVISRSPHKNDKQEGNEKKKTVLHLDFVPHYDHDISLLHTAAEHGDVKTIERLYRRGVNINARNENGETALFLAALYNQKRALTELRRFRANVHIPDKLGQTPLFIAATENLVETIKVLVTFGACVNAANTYGCTPIYGAAMNGCMEAIQLLHELGANLDTPNKTGIIYTILI